MSLYSDMEAEAHFDTAPKKPVKAKPCGFCENCQSVKRWKDTYWNPFIKYGGDIKWAKKQMALDRKHLPCRRKTI